METAGFPWPCARREGFWTSYEGWKQDLLENPNVGKMGFWTSYEGWKPHSSNLFIPCDRVFELPMRDGNTYGERNIIQYFDVFELPMRDGNVASTKFKMFSQLQFLNFLWGMETNKVTFITISIPGFWTSYEGWKHKNFHSFPKLPTGFWTSYEGWKLNRTYGEYPSATYVFELPMRDGNCFPLSNQKTQFLVFELPMRDGNTSSMWTKMASLRVFELPMRDGNILRQQVYTLAQTTFLNFLWGMETTNNTG